jgi:teichuronic acid biosynthesis glycosyltransferase TuaG
MRIAMSPQLEQARTSPLSREDAQSGELRSRLVREPEIDDLVSVVMPVHNKEALLADSIESILGQGYQKWELIIVDDASSDGSLGVAERFSKEDPRIRFISLESNRGVAHARNAGIAQARGRYLAFLDSDDIWLPNKLIVQVAFMKERRAAFSFSQFRRFTADGWLGAPLSVPAQVSYEDLLKGNVIGCLTVMMDRAQVGDIVMPPVRHEDYVAWLTVLRRGHVAFGIQEDLARYRISRLSVSGDKARSAAWTWQVYRRSENLPLWKSIWCFAHYFARAMYNRYSS